MPTNRNNNELGKAFAVGTKIEERVDYDTM